MNKILIIEDEKDTALPVKEALKFEGIEADVAEDGEIGLKLFEENEYDLVLLDLKMPKMDGATVLREIRKNNPYVDVIIYTNYYEFDELKALANVGIDGYINKGPNADLNELITAIKNKLDPLSEDEIKKLIENTSSDIFNH